MARLIIKAAALMIDRVAPQQISPRLTSSGFTGVEMMASKVL